jgi:hypothetical protein
VVPPHLISPPEGERRVAFSRGGERDERKLPQRGREELLFPAEGENLSSPLMGED